MSDDCEKLLKFDTTIITRSLSAKMAFIDKVSQNNYDEIKSTYGGNFMDLFSSDFGFFEKRRNEYKKYFSASGSTDLDESYYKNAVSKESLSAYNACLVNSSKKLIVGWVDATTENQVVVAIRIGVKGHDEVEYSTTSVGGVKYAGVIFSSGPKPLQFPYNPKEDFLVIIEAKSNKTSETDYALVKIPRVRNFIIDESDKKILVGIVTCGAGGHGKYDSNRIWSDGALVAEDGYYIKPETLKEIERAPVWKGGGLGSFDLRVKLTEIDGKVRKIDLHPDNIIGADPNTQGNVRITYQVTSVKPKIVEL